MDKILQYIESRNKENQYNVFFDGACPVNPYGPIGYGFVVFNQGKKVHYFSDADKPKKTNTNNLAEHLALNAAMKWAENNLSETDDVVFFGDSDFVIKQMLGVWQVKDGKPYSWAARENEKLRDKLSCYKYFVWIPRDYNTEADEASNDMLYQRRFI